LIQALMVKKVERIGGKTEKGVPHPGAPKKPAMVEGDTAQWTLTRG